MIRCFFAVLCLLIGSAVCSAEDITLSVIAWNLQSGDSNDSLLAEQCAAKGRIDIWGFSELKGASTLSTIETKLEGELSVSYSSLISTNAGQDKLGILYNSDRLELVSSQEITAVQLGNSFLRPALAARFKGKTTGQKFFFVVNHLKAKGGASNQAKRIAQSKILNDFAETVQDPVLCVGDFNYLYKIDQHPGGDSPGFAELTADGVFAWIEPQTFVQTENTANTKTILDFVFVANKLAGWDGTSVILERAGNTPATTMQFPTLPAGGTDDDSNTDHRPVKAVFTFTDDDRREAAAELRARISVMRDLLRALEQQLEALEAITNDS